MSLINDGYNDLRQHTWLPIGFRIFCVTYRRGCYMTCRQWHRPLVVCSYVTIRACLRFTYPVERDSCCDLHQSPKSTSCSDGKVTIFRGRVPYATAHVLCHISACIGDRTRILRSATADPANCASVRGHLNKGRSKQS